MKPENTPSRRRFTRCRICDKKIPAPILVVHGLIFCKEHKHQFLIRRREQVSTAQLSAEWGDILDNWNECPAVLTSETGKKKGASRLFFTQHYEHWQLFMRYYSVPISARELFRQIGSLLTFGKIKPYKASAVLRPRKGRPSRPARRLSRLGDGLAINTQTGEIRRFVDVMEGEVLDDLQGIRSAPGQAEVAAFWGNPAPTGMRERLHEHFRQQVMAPGHRLLIPELVRLISFPLYGLVENPPGFLLRGAGWSGQGRQEVSSVSLSFRNQEKTGSEKSIEIHSAMTNRRGVSVSLEHDEHSASILDDQLFRSQRLSDEQRTQAGAPILWRGELLIDKETFSGEIRLWSQPCPLARFSLKNAKIILSGHACGLTQDELIQLLQDLKMVNQQSDILAQYQREFDEERARLIHRTA